MITLRQVIEEAGDNYMEEVRNGSCMADLTRDAGYSKCACCGDYVEELEMEITSGMTGGDEICEPCFRTKKSKKIVKEAILDAIDNGYTDYK